MQLTKRESADRQLNEAILMLLSGRDPVAIHTLVGAASLIYSGLIELRNPDDSWDKKAQESNNLSKKQFFKVMRNTQNFLKHGQDDPEGELEFDIAETLSQIIHATMNNAELGGVIPREQSFYQLWYLAGYYKEIEFEEDDIPHALEMFGDISSLSLAEKLNLGYRKWREVQSS